METLRDQIFSVTNNFIDTVRQLTEQHAAAVLQQTFSSLGSDTRQSMSSMNGTRPRGAKRGADELEQLSARFVQFVRDNPGLRIEQINKQLGTTTASLALPIRKLIAEGKITVKGQKRSTTYFADKGSSTTTATGDGEDTGEGKTAGKSRKRSGHLKKSRSAPRSRSRSRSRSKK
jgi:hypothetical protein